MSTERPFLYHGAHERRPGRMSGDERLAPHPQSSTVLDISRVQELITAQDNGDKHREQHHLLLLGGFDVSDSTIRPELKTLVRATTGPERTPPFWFDSFRGKAGPEKRAITAVMKDIWHGNITVTIMHDTDDLLILNVQANSAVATGITTNMPLLDTTSWCMQVHVARLHTTTFEHFIRQQSPVMHVPWRHAGHGPDITNDDVSWTAVATRYPAPFFYRHVTELFQRESGRHVLHLFLRYGGAAMLQSWDMVKSCTMHLAEPLVECDACDRALDLMLVQAVGALCRDDIKRDDHGHNAELASVYVPIGNILGTMEQRRTALAINVEGARLVPTDEIYQVTSLATRACSHQSMQELDQAEQLLVQALHRDTLRAAKCKERWDVNDERSTQLILSSLTNFYQLLASGVESTTDEAAVYYCGIWCGLLYYAKFDCPIPELAQDIQKQGPHVYGLIVAERFRTKAAAIKTLQSIGTRSATPDEFRRNLIHCIEPYGRITLESTTFQADTSVNKNRTQNDGTAGTKDDNDDTAAQICAYCGQHATANCPLLACPCQAALYCSTACQRAQWKSHKRQCAYHRDKKKTARNADEKH